MGIIFLGQRVSELRADEARGIADYCYGTSYKETGSGADDLELGVVQFRGCRPKLRDPRS
jgi:hypothetical protein